MKYDVTTKTAPTTIKEKADNEYATITARTFEYIQEHKDSIINYIDSHLQEQKDQMLTNKMGALDPQIDEQLKPRNSLFPDIDTNDTNIFSTHKLHN